MNCSYHSQNPAMVNCNGCSRPLCAACDHRIKGFPFCEDCIVSGVDMLRRSSSGNGSGNRPKRVYPFIALVLSWVCPGLGAAYNGQTVKALVHFGIVAGLFQMAVSTGMAMFIIGLLGMWLFFLPLDAWRSAKIIRAGTAPEEVGDLLIEKVTGNAKVSAFILIGIGVMFFINLAFGVNLLVRGALPILLILLGLYLLKDFIFPTNTKTYRSNPRTDSYPSPVSFYDPSESEKLFNEKNSWKN